MDPHDQLARLRAEVAHIAAFATDRDLGAPVPSCPGLTAGEVIRHLGSVYRRVTGWVRTQASPGEWQREPSGGHVLAHRLARDTPGRRRETAYAGGSGQSVGVAAGSHVWRVELGSTSVQVTRELPHDADAVVMGDCAAVYLWLWGRRGDDAIRINGDRHAVAELRAALAAATQ
jgi:hypothetical protein